MTVPGGTVEFINASMHMKIEDAIKKLDATDIKEEAFTHSKLTLLEELDSMSSIGLLDSGSPEEAHMSSRRSQVS